MDFPYTTVYGAGKRWADCHPGWYELEIDTPYDTENNEPGYYGVIRWLYENVDKCERHCIWRAHGASFLVESFIRIKCRYERDYIWLKLTWG